MSRRDEPVWDREDEVRGGSWMSRASVLVGVTAVAGFVALAWYAYHTGRGVSDPSLADLVKVEAGPMKEVPADPGGWEAPHQDKTIYDVFRSGNTDEKKPVVERLTPPPEEPMDIQPTDNASEVWMNSRLKSGSASDVPLTDAERLKNEKIANEAIYPATTTETTNTPSAEPVKSESNQPATAAQDKKASDEVLETASKPVLAQVEKPITEEKTKAESNVATKKAVAKVAIEKKEDKPFVKPPAAQADTRTNNTTRIQLGAFRTDGEAKQHLKKVSGKAGDALDDVGTSIERADLGSKGIYYRLFAGPFDSKSEAKQACAQLSAQGIDCIVK